MGNKKIPVISKRNVYFTTVYFTDEKAIKNYVVGYLQLSKLITGISQGWHNTVKIRHK